MSEGQGARSPGFGFSNEPQKRRSCLGLECTLLLPQPLGIHYPCGLRGPSSPWLCLPWPEPACPAVLSGASLLDSAREAGAGRSMSISFWE